MFEILEGLGDIALVVGVFGLIAGWRQYRSDHDRSRREKAIEYILVWVQSLNRRATLARKLVETFNHQQAKALIEQRAFKIDDEHAPLIEGIFEPLPVLEDEKYKITQAMSAELRWIIVSYINNLEAIMAAWYYHVADRKIIAEQFAYLISPSNGHFILEEFRATANDAQHYPAISAFVRSYKASREETLAGKDSNWRPAG